jgi:thiamine pyrophosphate-dependent acetolactate synthase large subunit-like protein
VNYNQALDFVKFAESLGVEAYKIEKPGDINPEFIRNLVKKKKPILFDCLIDPEDIAPIGNRIKEVKK